MATSSHLLLLLLIVTTITIFSSVASPTSHYADRIIEAMIGAGVFRDWATDFLAAADNQVGIPHIATIFIPTDFNGGANLSVAYHIVPRRLSFTELHLLQPLSRLPTLLPGNSIVVTKNSASDFTLDGVLVSEPDLFLSSSIVIHGVASTLDFSRYGNTTLADRLCLRPLPPSASGRESNITPTPASSVSIATCWFLFPLFLPLLFVSSVKLLLLILSHIFPSF